MTSAAPLGPPEPLDPDDPMRWLAPENHPSPHREVHADVAVDAAATRWDGTRLDRSYAVSCLAESRGRPRRRLRGD